MRIERIDPRDLDLGTADEIAAVDAAGLELAGLSLPAPVGPSRLTYLQRGSEDRPVPGLWLAREEGRMVGHASVLLPTEDNTDSADLRGAVLPAARRRGVGGALLEECLGLARAEGRTKIYAGAFAGTDGVPALEAWGFSAQGLSSYAVRRVDLHATPAGRWQQLYDEAADAAADYELVHLVGPTPDDLIEGMVTLHAAINDAPKDAPDAELSAWHPGRVRAYDRAMAARRQTVYRVLARHRGTGAWAGLSLLCVDEFSPTVAFQEDTSVVREHRGHRLGVLMKADMLRWITEERPEVAAADTWNATTNHHMIAVNERLGATVVAHHHTYRLQD